MYINSIGLNVFFTFFSCTINVFQVADKLAKGRLSLAAIGNLKTVPYLDELK